MSISRLSSAANVYVDFSQSSMPVTASASITSGDLMLLTVEYGSPSTDHVTGVSGGGTWAKAASGVVTSAGQACELWWAIATSTAAHTVTASLDSTYSDEAVFLDVFQSTVGWDGIDDAIATLVGSTTAPSVSIATTANGCLIYGTAIDNTASGGYTAGSGFSTVYTGTAGISNSPVEWKEQATASGSTTVDFTCSSRDVLMFGAAFRTVAASGTTMEQEGYRIRNDDGSESSASWKAAQDTAVSMTLGAARVRVLLDATGDPAAKAVGLKYAVNGGQKRSVN